MITDFIAISDHMLQRVAHATDAAATGRRHVEMGMHAVVEQALPSLVDSVSRSRKLKGLVREESMRRFLNDVVNEREGYRVATSTAALNPENAVPLPQLLQTHVGNATTSVQTWKQFVNSNKAVLEQVLDVVEKHRQQVFSQQHLFGLTKGGSSSATVVAGEQVEEEADEVERAHRVMRECVLRAQSQVKSPPPSPKQKRVYTLTESERQVSSVSRLLRRQEECTLTQLFYELNVDDALIPENYAPPFDRNDLFLTNVDACRELTVTAAKVTEHIVATLNAKQAVDYSALPSVKIVLIEYHGPLDETHTPSQCGYVTWAEQASLRVDPENGRALFLNDVLNGSIRLNTSFTELLDKAARHGDTGVWKRRFSLHVIDDCVRFVSEQQLPAFVAALDLYAEQYECTGVRGNKYGLNFMHHNHARHRLIYEAGSIESYQLLWLYVQAKSKYDKLSDKAHRHMKEVVDIVLTFWQKLCTHLLQVPLVSDEQVGAAVSALGKLSHDKFMTLQTVVNDVRLAHKALKRVTERRVAAVETAHAAAEVRQFRNGVPIPASLATLHATVVTGAANQYESLDGLKTKLERVTSIYDMAVNTWFFVGMPTKTLHQQQDAIKHHNPVRVVQVLRALTVLRMWSPTLCSAELLDTPFDMSVALPPAAPRLLSARDITEAHRGVVRGVHPDHHRHTLTATADTQLVNSARDLLTEHYVSNHYDMDSATSRD